MKNEFGPFLLITRKVQKYRDGEAVVTGQKMPVPYFAACQYPNCIHVSKILLKCQYMSKYFLLLVHMQYSITKTIISLTKSFRNPRRLTKELFFIHSYQFDMYFGITYFPQINVYIKFCEVVQSAFKVLNHLNCLLKLQPLPYFA